MSISGQAGLWRVTGVSADGSVLSLSGRVLTATTATLTIVVGGNATSGLVAVAALSYGITLTRTGFDWRALGYCQGSACRPVGADLVFGGAGTDIARNDAGEAR